MAFKTSDYGPDMVLRTLAFVLFGFALCTGVFLGWGYSMEAMLYGTSARSVASTQLGLQRLVGPDIWRALFEPLFELPAWAFPAFLGTVFMIMAVLRPGRG